jgi:glycosyltransferase involved in cell wall biosynthesis
MVHGGVASGRAAWESGEKSLMERRCKIAMVAACPFPYSRGTPVRIFRMAEALARKGVEVHVVTYNLGEVLDDEKYRYPFDIHRICKVKTYKKLSPGPSLQKLLVLDNLLFLKILEVLRKYQIDIIHAHHYEGLIVALMAKNFVNLPIVYDAHTMLESELPFYRLGAPGKIKEIAGRFFDNFLPRHADHIITVTEDIKHKLVNEFMIPEKRISVVTNGIENEHFSVSVENPHKRNETILIYSGNLAEFQGIDLLLKSFQILLKKRDDLRLYIVTNSSFAPYQSLANDLGISSHIDIIQSDFDTLPTYLHMADVALNPRTVCDGIPQKLLNYMAAGKPIVSFAGSAKVLKHKETGYIVEGTSFVDFAEGVLEVLDNPDFAQGLGVNAQGLSRRDYGWEKLADETLDVYNQILDTRANPQGRRMVV